MPRKSVFLAFVIALSAGTAQAQIRTDATAYEEAVKQANELSARFHEFEQMNAVIGTPHQMSASDVAKLNAVVQDVQRTERGFEAIARGRSALGIHG